ncbi:hypothetical protein [Bizionia sp.]|uniref:hypothetical protein n=1 Tax=Bizionia sp. TaxID=1954480 RepID=UPI003A8EDAFC
MVNILFIEDNPRHFQQMKDVEKHYEITVFPNFKDTIDVEKLKSKIVNEVFNLNNPIEIEYNNYMRDSINRYIEVNEIDLVLIDIELFGNPSLGKGIMAGIKNDVFKRYVTIGSSGDSDNTIYKVGFIESPKKILDKLKSLFPDLNFGSEKNVDSSNENKKIKKLNEIETKGYKTFIYAIASTIDNDKVIGTLEENNSHDTLTLSINPAFNLKFTVAVWIHYILEFFALIFLAILAIYSIGKSLYHILDYHYKHSLTEIIESFELLFLAPIPYLIVNGYLGFYKIRYDKTLGSSGVKHDSFREKIYFVSSLSGVIITSLASKILKFENIYEPEDWLCLIMYLITPIVLHILTLFILIYYYNYLNKSHLSKSN